MQSLADNRHPARRPDAAARAAAGPAADAASPVHAPAAPVSAAPFEPVLPPPSNPAEQGQVDEEGTVYVRTADGERAVGSWQASEPGRLAGRRYDDLATEVALLRERG